MRDFLGTSHLQNSPRLLLFDNLAFEIVGIGSGIEKARRIIHYDE